MARIMSGSKPLPGTVQRAARQLGMHNNLSPSIHSTVTFVPSIGIITSAINKLGLDIRSFRVPLDQSIRQVMVPSIRRNFDEGGRPKWEPLADATINIRQKFGFDDRPLIKTGKLRRVATQINIWSVGINSAVIEDLPESVFYGKIHQAGANPKSSVFKPVVKAGAAPTAKRLKYWEPGFAAQQASKASELKIAEGDNDRHIPARPFLIIQPEDEIAIQGIFAAWLDMRVASAAAKMRVGKI